MAEKNSSKYVLFRLGKEIYAFNIMIIDSIVQKENVCSIPNAPKFIEGIYDLRGEIIPVINLHERFSIASYTEDNVEGLSGMVIIKIGSNKIAVIVDYVLNVAEFDMTKIQNSPTKHSKIGNEYIQGIFVDKEKYIIILNANKIFDSEELQQLTVLVK